MGDRRSTERAQDHALRIPSGYPTATLFMDESGSRAGSNGFFVVGAVKVRKPGELVRAVQGVRDRHEFHRREFKFSEVNRGSVGMYYELIDALQQADALLGATVIDRQSFDPFSGRRDTWRVESEIAAQLLAGCINKRELVAVLLDGQSSPPGVALDDEIKRRVNQGFRAVSVVSAVACDSRTHDGLQLADLVAGAIAHDRRVRSGRNGRHAPSPTGPKAQVARRLMETWQVESFCDQRDGRLNIATLHGKGAGDAKVARSLKAV